MRPGISAGGVGSGAGVAPRGELANQPMGTFHHDAHALHGITCVVDTTGPLVIVGRVDHEEAGALVILDADVHEDVAGGPTKVAFVEKAARFGHWPRHPRVAVPMADIASIRKLGDVEV